MTKPIKYIITLALCLLCNPLFGAGLQYENQPVEKIEIEAVNLPEGTPFDASSVKSRIKTREGNPFSQSDFDNDLKTLVQEFDSVIPSIKSIDGRLFIMLKVCPKPAIRTISWYGNCNIKTSKLQSELDIAACSIFDRQAFNKAFHKLKEYYVKQGYFEAELSYKILPDPCTNTVDIEISICEGRAGRIKKINFCNFTKCERDDILSEMITKKYYILTSWYTGEGVYNEEAVQQDRFTILNYLQNEGYADAVVDIYVEECPQKDRINITVEAEKGDMYYFGPISFEGNTLFCDEDIEKLFLFDEGDPFSPEAMRDTVKRITDFYGRRGYIDAVIDYEPHLDAENRTFSVDFTIEEGEQFRVGLVKIYGNTTTNTNVILHETLLTPGEIFNIIKLQLTEERLQNIGYFKHVNVYAVRSDGPGGLGGHYRDVHIEVEETITGNFGAGFGLSSTEGVFGEFKITERNFNHEGLCCFLKEGLGKLRGGGEVLNFNAMIGSKSRKYSMSWTKPYFRDTPWIVGFEIEQSNNRYISDDYEINAAGITFHGAYPLNQFLRMGVHYRLTYTDIDLNDGKVRRHNEKNQAEYDAAVASGNPEAIKNEAYDIHRSCMLKEEADNSGVISAIGINLNYDSTNNPQHPCEGIRSRLEQEIAGFGGHQSFMSLAYLNTYYKGLGENGVLKLRADMRFIVPLFETKRYQIPLNERLFLGGDSTIRGYRVYRLGPQYNEGDPRGGMSMQLLSAEYTKFLHRKISAFFFVDSGHLSFDVWNFGTMWTSVGFGFNLRLFDSVPPVVVGIGFPLNPDNRSDVKRFFFNIGGQF